MKNLCKAALLLILLLAFSCSKSEHFEIINNATEGFYLIDMQTAKKNSAEGILKLSEDGKIPYVSAKGGGYEYVGSDFNASESEFDKYKKDGKLTFFFVTEAVLEKAKKNKSKVEYEVVNTGFEMKDLTKVTINIKDNHGKPDFELTLESER